MTNGTNPAPEKGGIIPFENWRDILAPAPPSVPVGLPADPATFDIVRVVQGPSPNGTYMAKIVAPATGPDGRPVIRREVRVALLDCGCPALSPELIQRCPCCGLMVCGQCRRPCSVCGIRYYAEHMRVSTRDGKSLLCRTHYEQGC